VAEERVVLLKRHLLQSRPDRLLLLLLVQAVLEAQHHRVAGEMELKAAIPFFPP
jgi:hypothetical protein